YTLHGPLFTGDGTDPEAENLWAIDMTVLEHQGKNYALWSGYLQTDGPHQHLFISPMADPVTLAGPRVRLFRPTDYSWERSTEQPGLPAIDEAPQVLTQGGRIFVAYSCGSALLPSYKLGLLELTGDDPLELSSWRKFPQPVFTSSDSTYGVGHGGYVRSPDGSQWWHIYHAKMDPEFGFRRAIFAQPFTWSADDAPVLGEPVPPNEPLAVPAGTPIHPVDHAQSWDLTDGRSSTADFDYYGHHQFIDHDQTGVHLGIVPAVPINDYRSGEKLVLRDGVYGDARVTAVFRFVEGDRDVGLLFRASSPAVGFDAERGYLAAISPARGGVVLGKMDGAGWHELAWTTLPIDVDQPQRLTVEAMGRQIKVMVGDGNGDDAVLVAEDADYSVGSVGVRVLDTHAAFESLSVHPLL
ncbi:MAG: family 43 glycosylhydrolase, partial [Nocardioidaceae bacterium]